MSRRKNNELALPMDTAEQILHQVFENCGYEVNNVPLEALTSYSNYRQERYTLQKVGITIVLLLFMLLPLLFISATIIVAVHNENMNNPTYAISVDTGIPIKQIVATIDGRTVPIYEKGSHEFIIQPNTNGDMSIMVTLVNEQVTSTAIQVVEVDNTPPELVSTDILPDSIRLKVSDMESGVDFEGVSVTDSDGGSYSYTFDADACTITVPYPDRILNMIVPDFRGNMLSIRLNPQSMNN